MLKQQQLELPLDDHWSFKADNDNHQTAWEAKFENLEQTIES